ncbi:MAG: SMC-Scp complex subunit ScpB [Syntrophales bacterium]|jgi:segregation and condensation protein B|nr:SMC-Scp complex subunit ScpB [Syntrophales bacterium]MDY0044991.1 SMC-Scp complex subunit ScpB [Syntrophales bacterium]
MENLKQVLEALLFVSEIPLSAKKLKEVVEDVEETCIEKMLEELMSEYENRCGGIIIQKAAGGYQFRTSERVSPWILKFKQGKPLALSPAAMETLAVVAYRQPVMKSEVEKVRGVDASAALKGLLEKKLIRIVGRKDVPGRPIMYGTTRRFLEVFTLNDLSELPTLQEIRELDEE